jgi:hypothetical protein
MTVKNLADALKAATTRLDYHKKEPDMCDYSLHNVESRPARAGEQLTTHDFGTGTRGFAASECENLAVCLRPGTELAFAEDVECMRRGFLFWRRKMIKHRTAIFRQINRDDANVHHDALEFPDGEIVLLTYLCNGQQATVLQLPVAGRAVMPEPAVQQQWPYVMWL